MFGMLFTALKWIVGIAIVVWGVLALLDWIGPTVPADLTPTFKADSLGDDLDAWLADEEAKIPDLRENAAKKIVWAGEPGAQTEYAIVYIHGFSATREEMRPVPDKVAEALGANLFFTRLTGHGRTPEAMGEATVNDWINDMAEAIAIGERLGQKVVLIGASMGGALSTLAVADPTMNQNLAGVVLISPSYKIAGFAGRAIEWPFAEVWGPVLTGAEKGFEPYNDAHAANWTTEYPTTAVATLGAVTHATRALDAATLTVPALVLVSNEDKVIDVQSSRRAAARWGAPSELVPVVMTEEDDPSGHTLAGDILTPNKTDPFVERIVAWIKQLPN